MRSILIHAYMKPSEFELSDATVPAITKPDQVLVRVHAAAINPVDMEVAAGDFKDIMTPM